MSPTNSFIPCGWYHVHCTYISKNGSNGRDKYVVCLTVQDKIRVFFINTNACRIAPPHTQLLVTSNELSCLSYDSWLDTYNEMICTLQTCDFKKFCGWVPTPLIVKIRAQVELSETMAMGCVEAVLEEFQPLS